MEMDITRIEVGPDKVNTYVVACSESGDGVIIDPGDGVAKIVRVVGDKGVRPVMVLNTHGHHDHVHGNAALAKLFNIPVYMHAVDKAFFLERVGEGSGLKASYEVAGGFGDGDRIEVGRLVIRVIHTPGHTPGSVCFLVGDALFTGDTLFVGDAGRTDLAGGSLDDLIRSIETKILPLPPATRIFPGHDYGERPVSDLATEKRTNIYITDFILDPD